MKDYIFNFFTDNNVFDSIELFDSHFRYRLLKEKQYEKVTKLFLLGPIKPSGVGSRVGISPSNNLHTKFNDLLRSTLDSVFRSLLKTHDLTPVMDIPNISPLHWLGMLFTQDTITNTDMGRKNIFENWIEILEGVAEVDLSNERDFVWENWQNLYKHHTQMVFHKVRNASGGEPYKIIIQHGEKVVMEFNCSVYDEKQPLTPEGEGRIILV